LFTGSGQVQGVFHVSIDIGDITHKNVITVFTTALLGDISHEWYLHLLSNMGLY